MKYNSLTVIALPFATWQCNCNTHTPIHSYTHQHMHTHTHQHMHTHTHIPARTSVHIYRHEAKIFGFLTKPCRTFKNFCLCELNGQTTKIRTTHAVSSSKYSEKDWQRYLEMGLVVEEVPFSKKKEKMQRKK